MPTLSFNSFKEDMQLDHQYINIAADNATYAGTGVDMTGYQGVVFIASCAQGTVATFSMKAQQDSASAYGTAADLLSTSVSCVTGTQADAFMFVEVLNPAEQYVRPVITVANLSTPNGVAICSIRYGKDRRPETNSDGEFHYAPAEGTA
jgi:hypothetical protein